MCYQGPERLLVPVTYPTAAIIANLSVMLGDCDRDRTLKPVIAGVYQYK